MENNKKQTLSIPAAIVVAGFIIMMGILIAKGGNNNNNVSVPKDKTLSEQVGVSKEALAACLKTIDEPTLTKNISTSVESAMSGVPTDKRGTPYSVIIGQGGIKTEILGAQSYENLKKTIDDISIGKVTIAYTGKIVESEPGDHIQGNPNAPVKIIEYSDYECPYCKAFQPILEKVVTESNGNVAWIYRHWPIHQNSLAKLEAAECIAKIKGNDAFWKYSDLLFGLLNPTPAPVTDQL